MPRTKKPAGTAVDTRNGRRADALDLGPPIEVELPRTRDEYHPLALAAWDGYWSQAIAATVTEADLMIAHTWIEAYDDALVKQGLADRQPLVTGSMGQQVANPLYGIAQARMTLAMQCARQLGIGGRNRTDLGLALLAAHRAGAIGAPADDEEDDIDDIDDDDPRRAA
jgi:hypothetical protein